MKLVMEYLLENDLFNIFYLMCVYDVVCRVI